MCLARSLTVLKLVEQSAAHNVQVWDFFVSRETLLWGEFEPSAVLVMSSRLTGLRSQACAA